MFDTAKLIVENLALKSKLSELEKELADLVHDMDRHMTICTDLTNENEDLRDTLKEAHTALYFFKIWGESLNHVLGYAPTEESWRPTLESIARIDAKLAEK